MVYFECRWRLRSTSNMQKAYLRLSIKSFFCALWWGIYGNIKQQSLSDIWLAVFCSLIVSKSFPTIDCQDVGLLTVKWAMKRAWPWLCDGGGLGMNFQKGTQKLLPEIRLAQDTSDMMPYGQSTLANRPQKVGESRWLINTSIANTYQYMVFPVPNLLLSLCILWYMTHTVGGRNPKQPPGMVLKPCK